MENELMWQFVADHLHETPSSIMLKYGGCDLGFNLVEAVTQIDCRRRTVSKLPSFLHYPTFYFPSRTASEQASNEAVARYHASLIANGDRVADLTAGLGIDVMTLAARAASADAFEMDADKCKALNHNAALLGIENLQIHTPGDSIEALRCSDATYDIIFIDPARRDDSDRRMYGLADCTPNVKVLLPLLTSRCQRLIIKASPMLDITQTERDLPGVCHLKAVSLRGECKEVLAIVEAGYTGECSRSAVLIDADGTAREYTFLKTPVSSTPLPDDLVGLYLYEPDSAVLKLGADANLPAAYPGLSQCDTNTQVYLSPTLHADFPGRTLRIEEAVSLNDRRLKQLKGEKRNVVCRNFPLTPEGLKQRLKLKDGGRDFIYGLTIAGAHRILLASHL